MERRDENLKCTIMIVEKSHLEKIWDRLASGVFTPAKLRAVKVGRATFKILHLARNAEQLVPGAYLQTGLSFYAWPRLAGYRHRFVLCPMDSVGGQVRWDLRCQDVLDWLRWSKHMRHVVTMSTLKSGASTPLYLHAQSFPLRQGREYLTALADPKPRGKILVDFGCMPHFGDIRISWLHDYPMPGFRMDMRSTDRAVEQAADKAFEFALNWNGLKAFDLAILPQDRGALAVYFFPRRKDGRCIYGPSRWQIAAIEANGLIQAKSKSQALAMDETAIKSLFTAVRLTESEMQECLGLVHSF